MAKVAFNPIFEGPSLQRTASHADSGSLTRSSALQLLGQQFGAFKQRSDPRRRGPRGCKQLLSELAGTAFRPVETPAQGQMTAARSSLATRLPARLQLAAAQSLLDQGQGRERGSVLALAGAGEVSREPLVSQRHPEGAAARFSTLIQLVMLDTCLFNRTSKPPSSPRTSEAATGIFRGKIKFAYDRLPPTVPRR
jgi:hypothetical protein